jgi:hypothetical protein
LWWFFLTFPCLSHEPAGAGSRCVGFHCSFPQTVQR